MTIRSSRSYDQQAHEQPTQASQWAGENREFSGGGGMGQREISDVGNAGRGEAPWGHSYLATGHPDVTLQQPGLQGPPRPYDEGFSSDPVRTDRLNREKAAPGGSDERYFKRTGYWPGHRPDGGNSY